MGCTGMVGSGMAGMDRSDVERKGLGRKCNLK